MRKVIAAKLWRSIEELANAHSVTLKNVSELAATLLALRALAQKADGEPTEIYQLLREVEIATQGFWTGEDKHWRHAMEYLSNSLASGDFDPPRVGGMPRELLRDTCLAVDTALSEFERAESGEAQGGRYLFDYVHLQSFGRRLGVDPELRVYAAIVATTLATQADLLVEYQEVTGDLGVMLKLAGTYETKYGGPVYEGRPDWGRSLRYLLHGIDPHATTGDWARTKFMLVDPATRAIGPDSSLKRTPPDIASLIAMEEECHRRSFDVALVIVPRRNATGGRELGEIRRRLVRDGRLLMVMELPDKDRHAAWLVSRQSTGRNEALFLNSRLFMQAAGSVGRDAVVADMASIANMWLTADRVSAMDRWWGGDGDQMPLYARWFANGYRDAPGLARTVSYEEIQRRSYSLSLPPYFKKEAKSSNYLIEPRAILELLQTGRCCIYVLGNNGQGKSLLLRGLMDDLIRKDRRVVAISSAVTDRFPRALLSRGEYPNPSGTYTYQGMRTTEKSIQLDKITKSVSLLMARIHQDQRRLDAFHEATALMGFIGQHFFTPPNLTAQEVSSPDSLADVIPLTNEATENVKLIGAYASRGFKLGLRREAYRNAIVPFDELSSGEQQWLTLAARLIGEAEPGAVMLIDEPETSLHVGWQMAVPAILEKVGAQLACSTVVATHSPVIVSSALGTRDHCFSVDGGELRRLGPSQRKSVEATLLDGFGAYTHNNRSVHEDCAAIVAEAIQMFSSESPQDMNAFASTVEGRLRVMRGKVQRGAMLVRDFQGIDSELGLIDKTLSAVRELSEEFNRRGNSQ